MSKVAILIDGGFFLKRLPAVRPGTDMADPEAVATAISRLVADHLDHLNKIERVPHARSLLYRSFFYDARPYLAKGQLPVSRKAIDYAKSPAATFRLALHDRLRRTANMAVRLGEVRRDPAGLWELRPGVLKDLQGGPRAWDTLTDDDFRPTFRQKVVDMRIGPGIASITLKRQATAIVPVAGDSDVVPAAKLARREGVRFVLDPMWQNVEPGLFEHIDGLWSAYKNPARAKAKGTDAP